MNSNVEEKQTMEIKYQEHLHEKNLARSAKSLSKTKAQENPNLIVAVYDLQALLTFPRGNTAAFYYKSRLNLANLTFTQIASGASRAYLWDETEGSKGCNEIATCVINYVETILSENPQSQLEFEFITDNCAGQQKNKFIIATYIYLLQKHPHLKSIKHSFLVVGHTQSEGDATHSLIEREIKSHLKARSIFVPEDYDKIIKDARVKEPKITTNLLKHSDFFDVKSLVKTLGLNFSKFKSSESCAWKIKQEDSSILYYKNSYQEESYKEIRISKAPTRIQTASIPPCYNERLKISRPKFDGLKELLDARHIPEAYNEFYLNLPVVAQTQQ